MKLKFCAVCGSTEDIKHHHFTPRIHGGSDDETNLLTLCQKHHCEIHGMSYRDKVNHRKLTMEGLQRARERGVKLGNPNLAEINRGRKRKARVFAYEHQDEVLELRQKGMKYRQICEEFMSKGYKTPGGKLTWYPINIHRILKKCQNS